MKLSKILAPLLALCLFASTACASTFIDAHGNEIQLDDSLEAYAAATSSAQMTRRARAKPTSAICGRTRCAGLPFPAKSTPPLTRTT
ncbi:MAG: hypothetical protein ACLR4A_18990 [Christensenellales bacterium]